MQDIEKTVELVKFLYEQINARELENQQLGKQVAELEELIKRAMIPTQEAMQQSQGNPVFLPQGSKLVAGHSGVFAEDKINEKD